MIIGINQSDEKTFLLILIKYIEYMKKNTSKFLYRK